MSSTWRREPESTSAVYGIDEKSSLAALRILGSIVNKNGQKPVFSGKFGWNLPLRTKNRISVTVYGINGKVLF